MSAENAIAYAEKYCLEKAVSEAIENGYTPEEALNEWDII